MPTPTDPAEWICEQREVCKVAARPPWEHDGKFTVSWETTEGRYACRMPLPDAVFVCSARTTLPKALDAIDAVLALHTEVRYEEDAEYPTCGFCEYEWPCPTVRAIEEKLHE